MKIKEIVSALERFAPLPLQDGFDNAGLQIGLTDVETTGVLLCLDVIEDIIDEAIALGCNFIISHHPLIFKEYKSIIGKDYIERCIIKAIKNEIVVYAAHTNLDNAQGGVNYKIAEKIGLKNLRFLTETGSGVVGELEVAESELEFLKRIKKIFKVGCLKHNKLSGRPVQKVALCGGSGSFLLPKAIDAEADVFLTGEMSYHHYFGHDASILIAEIGHYESEQYTEEIFYDIITELCPTVSVYTTELSMNPIKYL